MKIAERTATWRRERRVLQRVSRAAWRLEQAGRERGWALASARAEGVSIRTLAAAAGLSPARVHQITAAADLDGLDAALGELRAAGWPAPEDPGGDDDAELDGRDLICDRLVDEVDWIRQCSGWLTRLHADDYPPAVGLRPGGDHPERALVVTGLPRVAAILDRIAPTSMNWPGPGGSRTWTPPRCCLTRGPNAAGGWPGRTWSSGPSAPGGGCLLPRPRNWSGPGTPGRPSATSAARSANGPATPATRSGHVNDHPVPMAPHQGRSGNWTP